MSQLRFLTFTFLLAGAAARAQTRLSLEALPGLVKAHNKHAQGARKDAEAARSATTSVFQPFYPTLTVQGGAESFQRGLVPRRQDPWWTVEAELNVFNGGRDYMAREALGNEARAAELGSEQAFLDELTKARLAFAGLVYASGLKKVLLEAKAMNERNLNAASRRRASGLATDTDQIEFEIKRQAIEQDLEATELEIRLQESTLVVMLGLDMDKPGALSWPDAFAPLKIDPKRLRQSKTDTVAFQIERLGAENKQIESRIALRWWVPEVDIYSGYELPTMRDSDEYLPSHRDVYYAGVRARLTLFDKGENLRRRNQLQLSAEAQRLRIAQSRRESEAELDLAQATIEKNERLAAGAESSAKAALRYLTQTLSEYARGVKNSPDVSAATDKYIEAESRHLQVQRDSVVSLAHLLALLGADVPENQ